MIKLIRETHEKAQKTTIEITLMKKDIEGLDQTIIKAAKAVKAEASNEIDNAEKRLQRQLNEMDGHMAMF